MKRRKFIQTTGIGIAAAHLAPATSFAMSKPIPRIKLGGPVFSGYTDPEDWIIALKSMRYRTALCPVQPGTDLYEINLYKKAAKHHDIVISEVGAWSNPISPDATQASEAINKCIDSLQLADEIGARCCVNVSGSKNPDYWAGPHKDNFSDDVFDQVVETTQKIIDLVRPKNTYFALEAMPWSFPDSPDSYLRLIKAINRKRFAVHLDPVNMITSVRKYFNNGEYIKEMFKKLGPYIKSCHAKDILLREDNHIPQLDEIRPGLGTLDYAVFLKELVKLKDVPLMMEHLKTDKEYGLAADYIRGVGSSVGIAI
jgi:sugar phosphate isomerase/epimerase